VLGVYSGFVKFVKAGVSDREASSRSLRRVIILVFRSSQRRLGVPEDLANQSVLENSREFQDIGLLSMSRRDLKIFVISDDSPVKRDKDNVLTKLTSVGSSG